MRRARCARPRRDEQVTLAGWVAAPARPRRRGLHRPARRQRRGAGRVPRRGRGLARARLRAEFCVQVTGEVRRRPAGNENPDLPTGEVEVAVSELRGAGRVRPAAVPDRGRRGAQRGRPAALPLPGHPAGRDGRRAARSGRRPPTWSATCCAAHGFVYVETPYLTRSTPEGATGLPGPGPAAAGQLVRAAPVAAAVQAAADGGRPGAVLPAGPLLPRRGLPGRPAARVHPDRPRDDLRHPGGRRRRSPRTWSGRLWAEIAGYQVPRPIPQMTYADAMARFGSDKPDLRFGLRAGRPDQLLLPDLVPGLPGPATSGAVVMPGGAGQTRRELDGWQEWAEAARRPRAGLRADRRGRRGVRAPGRWRRHLSDDRAGRACPRRPAPAPGDCVFFAAGTPNARPVRCSARPGWRSAAAAA